MSEDSGAPNAVIAGVITQKLRIAVHRPRAMTNRYFAFIVVNLVVFKNLSRVNFAA